MSSQDIIAEIRNRHEARISLAPLALNSEQVEIVNNDVEFLLNFIRKLAIDLGCTDSDLEEIGIE